MSLSAPSSSHNEFADTQCKLLNRFLRAAWGHPEYFLKKATLPEAGVIEFIDLVEHLPIVRRLFSGIVKDSVILVRDEYRVALDALQGDRYCDGAFVIGHPGIGKTLFLVYLIVHFLGQKHAVAIQLSHTPLRYAFFSEEGANFQSSVESGPLFNLNDKSLVWVLCDSNHEAMVPHSAFLSYPDHLRVIQTTSPKASRWKEWSKQVGARRFVMDLWSGEEVKNLALLLKLDVERMTQLAKKWGGVPRILRQYYLEPDDLIEGDYRMSAPVAVQQCSTTLQNGVQCDLPNTAPSSFYFLRPHKTYRHAKPRVVVPTRTLCCFLVEGLQQVNEAVRLQFFHALSGPLGTRVAAGFIFESWFHSFFSMEHKEIQCKWVTSHAQDGTMQNLPSTTTVISATQTAPSSWVPPFYWVPPTSNFPGIDSALVLENEIFAIQLTIAKNRRKSSPADGMLELRKLLPNNLKDLSWSLMFVGTEKDRLEDFAKKYTGKLYFPTKERCVRVGWSVVDPVQTHVIFKQCFDEAYWTTENLMEDEPSEEE